MGIEMGVFFLSSEQTLTSFLCHKARNDHHRANVLVTVDLERQRCSCNWLERNSSCSAVDGVQGAACVPDISL